MSSTQLCRLCLETGAGLVNIFGQFEDSTIASVLATHYWFQINKDDGMPEWVCETCWTQTETFHHFYKKLELRHQKHLIDEIKQERSASPVEMTLEPDFVVHKYEEETEIAETTEDTPMLSKESSCDEDDRDKTCDQSEGEGDQSLDKPINGKNSRPEVEEQDAEIRRFFQMTCEICSDVEFETLKKAKKHYREVHKTKGYLICCGRQFSKRYRMLSHIQFHVNPEAHRCERCNKTFRSRDVLKSHAKVHAPLRLKSKCELCSKFYATPAALKSHVQDKHPSDTSVKFHCDICDKTYPTKNSLTSHMRNSHGPSRGHICDGCARKFKNKTDLKNHIEMEHSSTPPPKVQCDICGAWLKHKRSLRFHLKIHQDKQDAQDGNAEVVNCPICMKKVQYKRLLAEHIRGTHGERKYQCTFCDKAFRSAKHLREHTALHTGEDLYSCTYCDRTFKSDANMYKHRKQSHLAEWTRDKAGKLELS